MSAASNMKEEGTDAMLWHAETPVLVSLAKKAMQLREEIYRISGLLWKSKQWRPKSKLPVEMVLGMVLSFARRRESLQDVAHPIVRRGEFPVNDAIMDDFLEVLRTELSDMFAYYQEASETSAVLVSVGGSEVTAAASVVAGVAAAAVEMPSSRRKRSYSGAREDDTATKGPKRPKGGQVATFPSSAQFPPASSEGGRSSVPMIISVAASSKGLFKWQIDKLMDWMKKNDYNPCPDWDAIDELVESTRMKPSQIVAWAREVGDSIAKLRSTGTAETERQHEVITIEDDADKDSVPELAEEDDGGAWNGGTDLDEMPRALAAKDDKEDLVPILAEAGDENEGAWNALDAEVSEDDDACLWNGLDADDVPLPGPPDAVAQNLPVMPADLLEIKDDAYLESLCSEPVESLESLILELGFDFGDDSSFRDGVQETLGATRGSWTNSDVESFEKLGFELGDLDSSGGNEAAGWTDHPNPTALCESSTLYEDELLKLHALSLDVDGVFWSDNEGHRQRPGSRVRSDSLDSLFACLLD
jgi:ribosomal protein S9